MKLGKTLGFRAPSGHGARDALQELSTSRGAQARGLHGGAKYKNRPPRAQHLPTLTARPAGRTSARLEGNIMSPAIKGETKVTPHEETVKPSP